MNLHFSPLHLRRKRKKGRKMTEIVTRISAGNKAPHAGRFSLALRPLQVALPALPCFALRHGGPSHPAAFQELGPLGPFLSRHPQRRRKLRARNLQPLVPLRRFPGASSATAAEAPRPRSPGSQRPAPSAGVPKHVSHQPPHPAPPSALIGDTLSTAGHARDGSESAPSNHPQPPF